VKGRFKQNIGGVILNDFDGLGAIFFSLSLTLAILKSLKIPLFALKAAFLN